MEHLVQVTLAVTSNSAEVASSKGYKGVNTLATGLRKRFPKLCGKSCVNKDPKAPDNTRG